MGEYEDELAASEYSEPEYSDQEDWGEGHNYYSDENDGLYWLYCMSFVTFF